ncbi:Hypothetical protein NocV09_00401730 [Nannochloropsis oceanica]
MLMLARLLFVVVACGVLVVSRVLIVQGEKGRGSGSAGSHVRLPMTFDGLGGAASRNENMDGPLDYDSITGKSSSSKLSYRRLRKASRAAAAPGHHYDDGLNVLDLSGGMARRTWPLQRIRMRLRSQVLHLRESWRFSNSSKLVAALISRLPQRSQRQKGASEKRSTRNLGLFAERLIRQLRRQQAGLMDATGEVLAGDGAASLDGVDSRYLSLLRSLEEEGHKALIEEGDDWHQVSEKEDTKVWKRVQAEDTYGREYPCLKLSTVLHAPPDAVIDLLVDSERVAEYNKYSKGRQDIAQVGPNTKIVRNRTLPPLQKRAHEFCTIMHVIRRPDGSQVMLTKYTDHPEVPRSSAFARSEIILGVTEVKPHPTDPDRAQLTTVSHVKSAGVPPFVAEKFSVRGVVDFADSLRKALHSGKQQGQKDQGRQDNRFGELLDQ